MNINRLITPCNPPRHNYQHLKYKILSKITYYAQSKQTPFQKKPKLITINEWLTYKIKEDT